MEVNIVELEKKAKKDVALSYKLGLMYFTGDGVKLDYNKAFYWMNKAATGGYAGSDCRYYLGRMYEKGLGVKNDYDKARKYYDAAQRGGDLRAKVRLADFYRHGLGLKGGKKNPEGAMNLYKEASELGSVDAALGIADLYLNGEGVEKDAAKAFEIYSGLAKKGNKKAKYSMAYCYQNGFGTEKDTFMAGHYLVPAAKDGDSDAQCYLALCFLKGDAVKQNLPKAVYWFKKSASQGNDVAAYNLAFCLQKGLGIDKNEKDAFDLFLQLAKGGHVKAYSAVARCYRLGLGTKPNANKAYNWIQKGVKIGDADCLSFMGYYYLEGKTYVRRSEKTAFKNFSKAATRGSIPAKFVVGQMYEHGIFVKQDKEKARNYINEAVEAAYAPALYFEGTQSEKDGNFDKAIDCYYRSAKYDYNPALVKMGIISEKGELIKKDEDAAFYYFKRAAENGSARGCYGLARCYEQGIGTEISRKKAFENYKLSATSGYADALLETGYRYMFGIGVKKDFVLAKLYLNASAKAGNPVATYYLGLGHLSGEYFKRSRKLALRFFEKSAELGYNAAYTKLGIAYSKDGKGFPNDPKKSAKYFGIAAEKGDGEALAYLANCYLNGIGVKKDEEKALSLLDESCGKNFLNGMYMKGFMLYNGILLAEDQGAGLECITKAAEAGYLKACNFLIRYYSAKGTEDKEKALHFKEIAVEVGDVMYAYDVARNYEKGGITEIDGDKASLYYARLALSDDKASKKKKALKSLKRFKTEDGVHWETAAMKKRRAKEAAASDVAGRNASSTEVTAQASTENAGVQTAESVAAQAVGNAVNGTQTTASTAETAAPETAASVAQDVSVREEAVQAVRTALDGNGNSGKDNK